MKVVVSRKRFNGYPFEVGDWINVCNIVTDNPMENGDIIGPYYYVGEHQSNSSWIISVDDVCLPSPIKPHKSLKKHKVVSNQF